LPANIYFPNAFTPNGDGRNDTFGPKGANSGLYNIRMFVYNRFGQLMYESPALDELGNDDGSFNWDGTKGGEIQPTGTYVWVVKFEVEKEKGEFSVEQYSGSVTLLR
jgi:gliding motility-associated-like protein